MKILPPYFYTQDTIEVARQLLGQLLVRELPNGLRLVGRIVETEAYLGAEDPACHGFGFRKTPRTEALYQPAGFSYVYFIYGVHYCFNVVTGDVFTPEAVLVRAVEVLEGKPYVSSLRPGIQRPHELANGPGKLCQAFQIGRELNRLSLFDPGPLYLAEGDVFPSHREIEESERVGLGAVGDATHWPLRYTWKQNPFISRPYPKFVPE